MCEKYNGWTNYETWNYALWNDSYSLADQLDGEYSAEELNNRDTVGAIAERLKDEAEEFNPWGDDNHGFYSDVLNASINAVNWYEIADHVIEALREGLEELESE